VNALIDAALSRARTVVLVLVTILVAGVLAYAAIPKEAEPDVEVPFIYVSVTLDGISPEDAERLLIRPLEQELRALEGIKELGATAYEGGANVLLEFEAGAVDTEVALQDVREKVDLAKSKFPSEAEEPRVQEVKFSRFDPMLVLSVGGNVPERTLYALVRDLREEIESLPGVLEVTVVGDREELVEVVVDPLKMESYGLDQNDLVQFVSRNNRLVAAGALQSAQGRFPVKVPGVFETAADVLSLPVKVDGDRVVHFSDVAEVKRTYKDAETFARLNGQPAVALEIVQRTGANVIETIDEVRRVVAEERELWPPGIEVVASRDKSDEIRDQLNELQNNVISAVLLVFIVIIGILGLRNALLVGIAIPGSFLAGILILAAFDITINIVVLFGLIMAVGMLVDGAIVVTEFADRKMAEGVHRRKAYGQAAKRMAWPIIAATATTLVAFVPLLFWPGVLGEFMKYLPMTLIATLAASLVMALVFVPTLGSLFGRPGALNDEARTQLLAAETGELSDLRGWTGRYVRFLQRALKRPWWNLGGLFVVLVAIYAVYFATGPGLVLFPEVEPETASVDVRARGDLSPEEKDALVRVVERRVLGMPEIESAYARVGGESNEGPKDVIGSIRLNFVNWQERRTAEEILAEIRERTADIAGLQIDTRLPQAGPPQGRPIEIEFAARSPERLDDAVEKVEGLLATIPGVRNIDDDRSLPGIEWRIRVDRAEAAKFGADVTLVGNTVQLVTNGIKIGEFRPDDSDEEIDIRVRYPEEHRSLDQLDQLRVPAREGLVPIGTFVTREPAPKVGTIERTDLRRTVVVGADLEPGVLIGDVLEIVRAELPKLGIDPTVELSFRGGNEEQAEASLFLEKAMLVALAMMAIILVTQFNSVFQAALILTAVVFATGGVLLGHLVTGTPFGIVMSGVGTIALAGIVVNNNIVLIDTYNAIRGQATSATEAVLRTCAQRLRPVLLTTVTTILGLMPMVLGVNIDLINRDVTIGGPGAQWWTQMASAVAGGLAFATFLTLLLTPSLLMIQARMAERRQARRARRRRRLEEQAAVGG
jgi:multidrug efflux pump